MATYRVLSIDWDYFIDASFEYRYTNFPDGHVFGQYLESVIWSTHYAQTSGLTKVGVNTKALVKVKEYIMSRLNSGRIKAVYCAYNHDECYAFIHKYLTAGRGDNLSLTNLDFHHDTWSTSNGVVDAGNWLTHLQEEFGSSATLRWVGCKDSPGSDYSWLNPVSLSAALKLEYDYIFICRSGLWSPPHLDRRFNDLAYAVAAEAQKRNVPTLLDDNIFDVRYNESFKQDISQILRAMPKRRKY